uniref:Uncharacterized protein n=1 Tax=Hippocampus comes TaxID=109280 RepID=A0A3Q2Z5H5_HIPCM
GRVARRPAKPAASSSSSGLLSCLRRLEDTTNDFKHSPHLNGRSPECTRRCLLRLERSAKDLSHSLHEKGRRPVWTSKCRRRSQDATKWTRSCTARSAGCRNLLEWARWCRRKLDGSENILPHCGHRKGFSPE